MSHDLCVPNSECSLLSSAVVLMYWGKGKLLYTPLKLMELRGSVRKVNQLCECEQVMTLASSFVVGKPG